jgi:hypothetical protein
MGEKSDQLERHIHETRNELGENIHELQEKVRSSVDKVKNSVDWRVQFQERPMTLIGIAFAGGLVASALFRRRGNSSQSSYSSIPSSDHWNTETRSDYSGAGDRRTKNWKNKAGDAWEDIKGAVIGLAATKAGSALEELLPGFQQHYQKRQEERRSGSNGSAERDTAWQTKTAAGTGNAGYLGRT